MRICSPNFIINSYGESQFLACQKVYEENIISRNIKYFNTYQIFKSHGIPLALFRYQKSIWFLIKKVLGGKDE